MRAMVVAIAGLLILTACNKTTPEQAAVANNAALMEQSLENRADTLDDLAANAADRNASEAIEDAANNLEDEKDNVADAADATIDNLR